MSKAWKEAQQHLAGGVSSPVRAFKAVGGEPVFIERGQGARIYDNNGRSYTDLCGSWGALLMGHAWPSTVQAVRAQALKGTSFGACTEAETALAVEIQKAFPEMERIRLTSSGTEAAMSAIRLARGFTGRERIVKFEGCYHGHGDSLLVKAGSGLATFGSPDSAGVPAALARLTSVLPYNDAAAARSFLRKNRDIACVIIEPVAANMGVVPADTGFLEVLREETAHMGALLIFDEVISGFRVTYGGAQHLYGIHPDLTVLGKIIGGGLPIGAFGGSRDIMELLSPQGSVYQAGTLSGNPLSVAAGLSVLSRLSLEFYDKLNQTAGRFVEEARAVFEHKKRTVSICAVGSMFTPFFSQRAPRNFSEVSRTDRRAFARFFRCMIAAGVYFPPSAFEASFVSAAHGTVELNKILESLKKW